MGDWDNMLTGVLAGMGALSQGVNAGLSRMHKTDLMRMAEEANKARDAARFEAQRQRDEEQRAEQRRRDALGFEPPPTVIPGTPQTMMRRAAEFDADKPSSLDVTPLASNAPTVTPDVVNLFGVPLTPVQSVAPFDSTATQELAARYPDVTNAYIKKGDVTSLNQYRSDVARLKAIQQARLAEAQRADTLAALDAVGKYVAANPDAPQPEIDRFRAAAITYYKLPPDAIPAYDRAGWKKAQSELGLNAARERQAKGAAAASYANAAKTKAETPDVSNPLGWMQANAAAYSNPDTLADAAATRFKMPYASEEMRSAARGFWTPAQKSREEIEANKTLLGQKAQIQAGLQNQKSRDALTQAISTALVKNFNFDPGELPETMLIVETLTGEQKTAINDALGLRARGVPIEEIRNALAGERVNRQVIDKLFPLNNR